MKYLIFLLPVFCFGQIKTSEVAFRFQNQYVGILGVQVVRPPAIPPAITELYTIANALSRTNEADDAATGLSTVGTTLASIESSPSPEDGTSLIEITSTDQNSDRMEVDLTLTNGLEYDIKYYAWEASGGQGRSTIWTGFTTSPDFDYTETPTEYTHTLTANSAGQKLRFYNFSTAKAYVDGLSIKQSNPTQGGGGEIPEITLSTLKAFPAAFGAGETVAGGRGGTIIAVTNLNDSGSGSWRAALSTSGARIIIPKVEGRVPLTSNMELSASNLEDATIWGQFAPGRGITISDQVQTMTNSGNFIFRHVTFQNADIAENRGSAFGIREAASGNGAYVDHCSFRYGLDQSLDFIGRFANQDWTMAYNLVAEPFDHTGSIVGLPGTTTSDTGDFTVARNFWYNVSHRHPNMAGNTGRFEVYNNYIVNWKRRLSRFNGELDIDWFNNYADGGNIAKTSPAPVNKYAYVSGESPTIFSDGNYVTGWDETPSSNQQNIWVYQSTTGGVTANEQIDSGYFVGTRQNNFTDPADGIWTALETPEKARAGAGHNRGINEDGTPGFFRDDRDQNYVTRAANGTSESSYVTEGSQVNSAFTGESLYTDTDGDYMPDWFETQDFDQPTGGETALNSGSSADRDQVIVNWDFGDYTVVNTAGYTNLEMCAAYYAGDFETILDGTNDLNLE